MRARSKSAILDELVGEDASAFEKGRIGGDFRINFARWLTNRGLNVTWDEYGATWKDDTGRYWLTVDYSNGDWELLDGNMATIVNGNMASDEASEAQRLRNAYETAEGR